jgi:hypothetical protein
MNNDLGQNAPAFFELASSLSTQRVIGCTSSGSLSIFDAPAWTRVGAFATLYDIGGHRLAAPNRGDCVIVGSYDKGIAAYDISGNTLWHRKDLKKCSKLECSNITGIVYCPLQGRGTHLLDEQSGVTVEVLPGVKYAFESSDGNVFLAKKSVALLRTSRAREYQRLRLNSYAVLGCIFAGNLVVVSEAGRPLRCIDLNSLSEVWAFAETDWHSVHIAATPNHRSVVAVWYCYEKYLDTRIVTFDSASGHVQFDVTVPRGRDYRICLDGAVAVSGQGPVYDVRNGKIVADLRG